MPTNHAPASLLFESLHIDGGGILIAGKCGEDHGTAFLQTRIAVKGDGTLHFSLEQRGFSWFDALKLEPPGLAALLAEAFIPAHLVLETYRLMRQGAIDKLAMLVSDKIEVLYAKASKALPTTLAFALLTHFTNTRFTRLEEICAKDKATTTSAPAGTKSGKWAALAHYAEVTETFNDWLVDRADEGCPPPEAYLKVESDLSSIYAGDAPLWNTDAGYMRPGQDTDGREPLVLARLIATFKAHIKVFADLLAAKLPEEK